MTNKSDSATANSLGHQLSHAAQLDGHFALCQTEYEAMSRAVGIQKGWHVLDAGCGTGSFLPLLAELVGAGGKVTAIDIAPENIQQSASLVETLQLGHTVTLQEGRLTQFEFENDTFDAVWCANVTQYLADEELSAALAEMVRVVKPGGLIGIKEFDSTAWQYQPAPPFLVYRLYASNMKPGAISGTLRPVQFSTWFHKAGLENIWLKNFVSETQPPLRAADKTYLKGIIGWLSQQGLKSDVSEADKEAWRNLADVEADDHILNRPDFYARENHILTVGTKPTG